MKTERKKDSLFVIKGNGTPASLVISGSALHIEKGKAPRQMRYIPNQPSPYVEDQKLTGNEEYDKVVCPVFENRSLVIPSSNPALYTFMKNHPKYGIDFVEYDPEKEALEEMKWFNAKDEAILAVRDMDPDTKATILELLTGRSYAGQQTNVVTRDLRAWVENDPVLVMDIIDDPDTKMRSVIGKAFLHQILILKNNNQDVHWNIERNKKKLLSVPMGETGESAVKSYFLTEEGMEQYNLVQNLIKNLDE